jgi:hypothetical protein
MKFFSIRMNLCYLAALLLSFCASVTNANTLQCRPLFETALFSPKPPDLNEYYKSDTRNKSDIQIKAENKDLLSEIQAYVPPQNPRKVQAIPVSTAYDILNIVEKHPVVGRGARERYMRDGVEIGYCFGRAMYIHLLLLKMGVQKESIRKIWSVGPTKTGNPNLIWGHHVSIMVYTKEQGWMTIDTGERKPQQVSSWMFTYLDNSVDGRVKFYITKPEKFGIETVKYNPVNLGFKLDRQSDWYHHYFVDMLASIRTETLEGLGLKKLVPSENQVAIENAYKPPRRPETLREKFLDTFWIFN